MGRCVKSDIKVVIILWDLSKTGWNPTVEVWWVKKKKKKKKKIDRFACHSISSLLSKLIVHDLSSISVQMYLSYILLI